MYASIRRYTFKTSMDQKSLDAYKGRLESKFVPMIQNIRGLHSYHLVKVSGKELIGFGIFEDKEGAAESSRRAAEFVKIDPSKDQIGTPEIIEGELWILREAPVTA
jgi:hypothetical protein